MSKLSTAINLIRNNRNEFLAAILQNMGFLFPDKLYLQLLFFFKMKRPLNLDNPCSFNEKLQWLKLYNRVPLFTTLVDKYAVKDYVAKVIGEEYIIPTLGIWDNAKDIDFEKLPNQFVLKTTIGGGGDVIICKNKADFNKNYAIKHLNQGLKRSIYRKFREWPYKDVPPKIIAEKYLDDNGHVPIDYKIYCFNGEPYKVMMCLDRDKEEDTKFYSFDFQWNLLRHNLRGKAAPEGFTLPKPKSLEEMYNVAKKLSQGIPFVRVDVYDVNGQMFFGEMTFFPGSGFDSKILPEIDQLYGSMIKLDK